MNNQDGAGRRKFLKNSIKLAAGLSGIGIIISNRRIRNRFLDYITPMEKGDFSRRIISMGTVINIIVSGSNQKDAERAVKRAFAEFHEVDRLMSIFRKDSELSLINSNAGKGMIRVDTKICDVIESAINMSEKSNGIFDVTVFPLMKSFGFYSDNPGTPDNDKLREALSKISYKNIRFDPRNEKVGLSVPGAKIDLGGIAKGFAVDKAADSLVSSGINRALIDAGGDIRVLGAPESDDGWKIGIRDPLYPESLTAEFKVKDTAIATSGNYERFVTFGNERIGHLFDPLKGIPSNSCLSATVLAPSAMKADALSTILFLKGREEGLLFIKEEKNSDCVIFSEGKENEPEIHISGSIPFFQRVEK